MRTGSLTASVWVLMLTSSGLTLSSAGCAGGRFGSELSARPPSHPLRDTESVKLRLPQDEPFSVALPEARRKPGLGGTADAEADAAAAGSATARAAVTESGSGLGMFQLGHAFENMTDRQMDLDFAVRYHYEFEATASPEFGFSDATVGLKLYARGARGRLLRDLTLIEYSTEYGPARRHADDRVNFTLTLSPGEAVQVFLAGRVAVEISRGRSASGSLALSHVQMEVVSRPAPPVPPAEHGQP